ncbi:hypothetical protein [Streptomyces sp. NPDC047981]|uniref:hypothetical protein n=1 Tax=Streptomyces sp. NPDC047981 TaxID=3154610 RepID=UPI0034143E83
MTRTIDFSKVQDRPDPRLRKKSQPRPTLDFSKIEASGREAYRAAMTTRTA